MDEKEFDTCTCILGKNRDEIIIDGLRYGLVPIPSKPKPATLSDSLILGWDTEDTTGFYPEEKVQEFVKQIKKIVFTLHYNSSITKVHDEIDKLAGDRFKCD